VKIKGAAKPRNALCVGYQGPYVLIQFPTPDGRAAHVFLTASEARDHARAIQMAVERIESVATASQTETEPPSRALEE
jgi:hypothetical protein